MIEKPYWWDHESDWVKKLLMLAWLPSLTIKTEERLLEEMVNNVIILETYWATGLKSAWLYGTPVWLHPSYRVYIKLKLVNRLVEEGKLVAYRVEDQDDRTWKFYSTKVQP